MKNIIYIATLCFTLACSSCDRDLDFIYEHASSRKYLPDNPDTFRVKIQVQMEPEKE